jgi:Spy/CpxP family protein refolding chaperone
MGGGGGGGMLMLLNSEQVQKELEMVDDQKQAVTKLRETAREEMRTAMDGAGGDRPAMQKKMAELREQNNKKLQAILLPEQFDRLKQLELQVQGASALAEKDVADALGLGEDQKAKLTSIREEFQAKRGEMFQGGGGGDRQAMRGKMEELRKTESDQMLAVLTADQKAKFESMKGKIIDIDRSQLGFGFGGGGGRRGGQGGQAGGTPRQ